MPLRNCEIFHGKFQLYKINITLNNIFFFTKREDGIQVTKDNSHY